MTNNQIYSSWHICHELKYGKTTARVICALSFFQTVVNIYTCRLTSVKGVRGWFRIKHALNSIMSMSTCFIFSNPEINLSWAPSRATDPGRISLRQAFSVFFLLCSTLSPAVWVRVWLSSSSADPTMVINRWHSDVDMTQTGDISVSSFGGS